MLDTMRDREAVGTSGDTNLDDLRRQLVGRLSLWLLVGSIVSMWGVLPLFDLIVFVWPLALSLAALGLLARRLNVHHPNLARHLLIWGMMLAFLAAMWFIPSPWLPFTGLLVILAGTLLMPGSEVFITMIIAGLTLWLASNGDRAYQPTAICLSLLIGMGLSWLLSDSLYTALHWALLMQQRADELLEEAQDRQGKLNSALKSLEQTSYFLERSNRELEIARRHADEARRMKEQFAANVSHELRTPLNLILGFSEMMYLSPDVYGKMEWPTALRGDMYHIYQSSAYLLGLIDDILDLSRYEMAQFTLNKATTSLKPLLRNAAEIASGLLRGRPIRLDVMIEPDLPELDMDETRIQQVVLNLLSNAQRFTTVGAISLEAKKVGNEVVVSVGDTGCGIPAEKLPCVFDEFFQVDGSLQRNHGGAGLGLAICKRFVEAHEGRIWVESQVGVRTAFHVSLPIPGTQAPTSYPRLVNPLGLSQTGEHPCVLVIDPDPAVATMISRHVEGLDVVHLADASHAQDEMATRSVLALVRNVPPLANSRSCSELRPDGGGVDCAVPVIECSLPSHAWVARDLAVAACLTKPINARQLRYEIDRLGPIQDIVVIDDDQGFGQLVERMLGIADRGSTNRSGIAGEISCFKVRHAYDGIHGLRVMCARRPDLVLLDLAMPGMDGFQTLEQMRREPNLANVPVILLTVTSYAEDALKHRAGRITIERQGGLQPVEVLCYLQAILNAPQLSHGKMLTTGSAAGNQQQAVLAR